MSKPKRKTSNGGLGPAQENIRCIADIEKQILDQRKLVDRVADAIGAFAGSIKFVALHAIIFTLWFMVNARLIPGIPVFDPYPYMLLSMVLSVEAVVLSTFVLMKQNRMSKRSDRRNELNLQIDLLAERESTKALQMLKSLCDHFELKDGYDQEIVELSRNTKIESLARELERHMPDD